VQALLGSALVALGTVGFFYNGDFTSNERVHDDVLGVFSVNGWENTLHIATGALALASRRWAVALALLYMALAIWGFAVGSGHSVLGILPVNTADNLLHLGIGLVAVGAR
jgi:Domain of unknown function (DUF4383)